MKITKLGRVFKPLAVFRLIRKMTLIHYISNDAEMRVPLSNIEPFEKLILDKSFRSSYQ